MTLKERVGIESGLKLGLSLALPVVFCAGYLTLQRVTLFTVRSFAPTGLDQAIGFHPGWIWAYQSLYLLTPLPWLAASAAELRRYARGFAIVCGAGFATFLFFPVSTPRPETAAEGLYALLITYDTPLNSFPSLHVAIAAYTALFGARILRRPAWLPAALGAWVVAIGYAALALKQHLAVDLPPALLLAWVADRRTWKTTKETPMPMPRLAACLAVLALVTAAPAFATEAEDRQALLQLKGLYEQAVNEDKLDLLAPHLDPGFVGVMITSEPVSGAEGMRAYWKRMKDLMGPAGRYRVTVNNEPAQFFGDIALARGTTEDVVTVPGKKYVFTGHWSAVCRKQDGAWKVLRIHASMDPLGNPFVKDWIRAGRYLLGGGGLAAGLVVGGLAGAMLKRRKATAA